jgi:hypothetical protein
MIKKVKTIYILITVMVGVVMCGIFSNWFKMVECMTTEPDIYTAVIVEPRQHPSLSFVLNNFLNNLPTNWNIVIKHGSTNAEFVKNIIDNELSSFKDRIKMVNLNIDNLSIDDYNKLLKSKKFYDNIPTEIFLIFQTDSIICPNDKHLLTEFLQYDYVGAPWTDGNVGNGGLSLRRKSKMLEIISKCKMDNQNEDIFFSNSCSGIKLYKPTSEIAKRFSVETVYNEHSFGVHKPWPYLSKTDLDTKCAVCSPLVELMKI